MTKSSDLKRIAFYASALTPDPPRIQDGILHYQDDHPGFHLRSFRFDSEMAPAHASERLKHMELPWGDWIPDGLIAQIGLPLDLPAWLTRGGQPLVITGAEWVGRWPSVFTTPDSIAALAIEHFQGLGFRHFAYVGLEDHRTAQLRWEAYARQLAAKGHHALLCELDNNPLGGMAEVVERASHETSLRRLLRTAPKPLAILTPGDAVGETVCTACRALGLQIPSEVAVIGSGNSPAARTCLPPLTSIHTPAEEVGYQAMALLDRLMRDGANGMVPAVGVSATRLVVRASTQAMVDNSWHVQHLRHLIHEQACGGVSIEQIVAALPVSRSTLQREFASTFGCTPGEELLRVRLEKAKELLRAGAAPKTVALAVGYTTASNFIRFFHKQTGVTPEAFRKGSVR